MARLWQLCGALWARWRLALYREALQRREFTARRRADHMDRLLSGGMDGNRDAYPLN